MSGLEKMGRRLDDAVKEYGKMINTRCYQLEKPLREIENLRREREGEVAANNAFEDGGA
ncbi:MAG TPA: DNA recombination protein RmuC [Firmicutes bacterium]|nr:DNA recombination protein RmuC [Bacillota bacterium]